MKVPTNTRYIFIEFVLRETALTREEAAYEFENFLTINGQVRTKESYMTVSRIGANFQMNRLARIGAYATFENAMNHAEFQ